MGRHAVEFSAAAAEVGYHLAPEAKLEWLTPRGHAHPAVEHKLDSTTREALIAMFAALGGNYPMLRAKTRGTTRADFLYLDHIVEYDERSHFTRWRLLTLDHYPPDAQLAFDIDEYRELIAAHQARGETGFAHKTAAEFPGPAGRARQRAYLDAFRDLAAPELHGTPVLRVACPEEDAVVGVQRFVAVLQRAGLQ
jgi:hypothetical protein